MQNRIIRSLMVLLLAVGFVRGAPAKAASEMEHAQDNGAKSEKAQRVTLTDLPGAVRVSVEKATAHGKIEKIDQETENGKVVYDVEAVVGGKHVEYTIAADGVVVGTETSIEYGGLPQVVRAAAEKHFGGSSNLQAMKAVEDGKTTYEVEGQKDGKKVTAEFDSSGRLLKEEK